MGNRSGFPVLICPSRCTSPLSSQFWVANHDMLNLVGSDREFLQISFWYISFEHCGPWNALSVLQFCRAEQLEVAPSWWRSSGLRKRPNAIGENFGWIHFLSRDVHECNRQFLDSNKESILSVALSVLFRTTRITLHCPIHGSSPSIRLWMGCRRYFVANRLEVLVDEDDPRSSSRVREHGSFLLVSQLHVAIQTLWSRCLCPRAEWTIVHSRVSPFLFDLRLHFRLRLRLCLNVQQTLAHNWKPGLPVLTIGFLVFGWVCWKSFTTSSNFWTQFFHPVVFKGNLRRRSRWRIDFLENDFSRSHHDSLRDTKSWKRVMKDDCVRSCLIELQFFPLSKLFIHPVHRILLPFPLSLVQCKTWFGQMKLLRILTILIHGIHGCKEYRLSFPAKILSSRYQSWICDVV